MPCQCIQYPNKGHNAVLGYIFVVNILFDSVYTTSNSGMNCIHFHNATMWVYTQPRAHTHTYTQTNIDKNSSSAHPYRPYPPKQAPKSIRNHIHTHTCRSSHRRKLPNTKTHQYTCLNTQRSILPHRLISEPHLDKKC